MKLLLDRLGKKFPGAVPFILIICYFERYAAISIVGNENHLLSCYANFKLLFYFIFAHLPAILVLYLNRKLNIDPSASTAIFHTNDFLVYFCTIVGGIIGDSWLGTFKTIAWMLLVFSAGIAIVAFGAIESINISAL